ncbi:MAG: SRPBCC family protein [FCB group bacterium]|jgi:hypothetical protein
MKVVKIILVILLTILVLLFVSSLFLPSSYKIERSLTMKAEPEEIFPYFDSLRKWKDWTVWNKKLDSTLQFIYEGKEAGVGAVEKWTSINLDNGTIAITKSQPVKMIEYVMSMDDGKFRLNGRVAFVLTSKGTVVSWGQFGDLGFNPMNRWFTFLFMDKYLGPDLEQGLANLKIIVEQKRLK